MVTIASMLNEHLDQVNSGTSETSIQSSHNPGLQSDPLNGTATEGAEKVRGEIYQEVDNNHWYIYG